MDQAIREAAERGAFDNLPGAGKPLPRDTGGDDFFRRYAAAEESGSSFLPLSLQLRKEAHDLPGRLARERNEAKVRALIADLNQRIAAEIRVPTSTPPLVMRQLDAEELVADWRAERERRAAEQQAALAAGRPDPAPQRRRWWRRRSR